MNDRVRRAAHGAALTVCVAAVGCSAGHVPAGANAPCGEVAGFTGRALLRPPADVAVVPQGRLYADTGPVGRTATFDEAVSGTPADIAAVQANAVRRLQADGWRVAARTPSAVTLRGGRARAVTVAVSPLCSGRLSITYRLS
jgi:hypothetical protein